MFGKGKPRRICNFNYDRRFLIRVVNYRIQLRDKSIVLDK